MQQTSSVVLDLQKPKRALGAGAPRGGVLAPKIAVPTYRPGTVRRDRLVDRLRAADATEVRIAAPAGYGKSTLAALWAEADPRPFAWVTADDSDQDPVVFLSHVALALDAVEPLEPGLLDEFVTSGHDWPEMLTSAVDVMAAMSRPFVLVVDDAHLLSDSPGTDVLAILAPRIPPGSSFALIERGPTPYPASRGVVVGTTLRLSVDDLAMSVDEAAGLLANAGLDLPAESVEAVQQKTEGWPAGLCIAALALRADPDPVGAVDRFTGGDRLVIDFMTEEVLGSMSAEDVEFLMATSVLSRLSGDLCDDVLSASGSGAVLERLARANQFVIPIGHEGEWFRYHRLFREVLQTELHARDRERVHVVARRASEWFEQHGEPEAAVEHALAAHDLDHAATLVWRHSPAMLADDRVSTVERWLEQFGDTEIAARPTLAVSAAWHAVARSDAARLHRLGEALRHEEGEPLPDGSRASAALAILEALSGRDGLTAMRERAARAYAGVALGSPYRAVASFLEGAAAALLDDLEAARELLTRGHHLAARVLPAVHVQCIAQLARVELAADDPIAAERLVGEGIQVMTDAGIVGRPVTCIFHSMVAVVRLRSGDRAAGDEARARGLELVDRAKDVSPYLLVACRLDLALAAVMVRDLEAATAILADAERRLTHLPDHGVLGATRDRIRMSLDAATATEGQLVEPLTPAELRVLAYLPTHLRFPAIGEELFLSRNTVKSHAMAIYRKLGVTCRADAVAQATRLQLLDTAGRAREATQQRRLP